MKLYGIIIFIFNVIISSVNILFVTSINTAWYMLIVYTALCTISCFLIDLIFAFLIRALPEKFFNPTIRLYKISNWEKNFYEFIGVKHFKDKVPEVGKGFRKNKISDPKNPEYIYRYMMECCYGEVIHIIGAVIGFVSILILPNILKFTIGIPVCIINAVLSLMPYCVLRYNRKKLSAVYTHLTNKK